LIDQRSSTFFRFVDRRSGNSVRRRGRWLLSKLIWLLSKLSRRSPETCGRSPKTSRVWRTKPTGRGSCCAARHGRSKSTGRRRRGGSGRSRGHRRSESARHGLSSKGITWRRAEGWLLLRRRVGRDRETEGCRQRGDCHEPDHRLGKTEVLKRTHRPSIGEWTNGRRKGSPHGTSLAQGPFYHCARKT
jgi:hypothetical protein